MSKTESRKLSDDYEVADVLGRGGFSIVRKGVSKSGGKTQVAIKTLRRLGPAMMGASQQGSKSSLPMWKQVSISDALLTNEILVMRRIVESVAPHPNVIGLHDVYEDAHGVHLILELCSGVSCLIGSLVAPGTRSLMPPLSFARLLGGWRLFIRQTSYTGT